MLLRESPLLRQVTLGLVLGASLALAACTGAAKKATEPIQPTELRGDPEVVAAAVELLEPRIAQLENVRYLRARCIRQEVVAGSGAKFVSDGPLTVRRDPPTILFRPGGPQARQILETETTRLVVDPNRKHATRWTYDRNGRGLIGVAALLLDIDTLAKGFFVESVGAVPGDTTLTRVVFSPAPGLDLPGVDRLELVFDQTQPVPRGLRIVSPDMGVLVYELMNTTIDPQWKDPEAHLRLEIPPGFTVAEER